MTWLVAVDPGIDATGVACFELRGPAWRPGETFGEVLQRLGPTTVVRTDAAMPLIPRLKQLGLEFATFLELPGSLDIILLEQPAAAGAYHARQGRQRTKGMINAAAMQKLHLALGVLIDCAVCHSELATDGRVELVPAPRIAKDLRHAAVLANLPPSHALRSQKRPSPDLLDAIYLGAAWLSDAQRRIEQVLDQVERRRAVAR